MSTPESGNGKCKKIKSKQISVWEIDLSFSILNTDNQQVPIVPESYSPSLTVFGKSTPARNVFECLERLLAGEKLLEHGCEYLI
tara:strand:- start:293 stop:544 length:252 start_codon:yes stop_codon:yes gene_type:complete